MLMSQENAYDIVQWGGILQEAMLEPIPIYKYGSNPGDDESLIGCLTLRKSRGDSIRLIHFGQISREDRIRQAAVDGRYEMYLSI